MNSPMMKRISKDRLKVIVLCSCFLGSTLLLEPGLAMTVDTLKAPLEEVRKELFGTWMMAVKVGSGVSGIVFSVARGSLIPLGMGVGLSAGIHLYDKYLEKSINGALI